MGGQGGLITGAVQRLLEGPQRSAPQTPPIKLFAEPTADSHPQDDVQGEKRNVATWELMQELEDLTVQAGPSLGILKEQALGSQIDGHVLEAPEVLRLRLDAIKWISSQFVAFGFRDEWLADVILYMDRLAVQMHQSPNFIPLGLVPNSSSAEVQAAVETMGSHHLWLAAIMIALKMSEAESELDTSIKDLVVPLVPFDANGLKCSRQKWKKIQLTELFVVRELDSRLMVPTALHFVQHLGRELQLVAAREQADWPGLQLLQLPKLLGPSLPSKELEDQRLKTAKENAMPERLLTKMQALARYLADLAVVHKPSDVYGDKLSPAVLAVIVLRLSLHAWGAAPTGCEARLDQLQEELDMPQASKDEQERLLAGVYRLWMRAPMPSPVVARWQKRDLFDKLPGAPTQEALPPELQESCFFNTPYKKKQEPKDLSATPGAAPEQEPGPNGVEEECNEDMLTGQQPLCRELALDKVDEPEASELEVKMDLEDVAVTTQPADEFNARTEVTNCEGHSVEQLAESCQMVEVHMELVQEAESMDVDEELLIDTQDTVAEIVKSKPEEPISSSEGEPQKVADFRAAKAARIEALQPDPKASAMAAFRQKLLPRRSASGEPGTVPEGAVEAGVPRVSAAPKKASKRGNRAIAGLQDHLPPGRPKGASKAAERVHATGVDRALRSASNSTFTARTASSDGMDRSSRSLSSSVPVVHVGSRKRTGTAGVRGNASKKKQRKQQQASLHSPRPRTPYPRAARYAEARNPKQPFAYQAAEKENCPARRNHMETRLQAKQKRRCFEEALTGVDVKEIQGALRALRGTQHYKEDLERAEARIRVLNSSKEFQVPHLDDEEVQQLEEQCQKENQTGLVQCMMTVAWNRPQKSRWCWSPKT
ncbi:unnamed protein product [Durusdinium trenchii]|uniref:Uncharacterized protein n=1 Tax=Durusdinium trenchii TaxID=1381693 RepID=A0ABP0RIA2_9DINO